MNTLTIAAALSTLNLAILAGAAIHARTAETLGVGPGSTSSRAAR